MQNWVTILPVPLPSDAGNTICYIHLDPPVLSRKQIFKKKLIRDHFMCTCEPCFWKVLLRPVVTPLPIILSTISGLSYNITDPVWCRQCQFSELVQCTIIMYNNDDTATGKSQIMFPVLFLIFLFLLPHILFWRRLSAKSVPWIYIFNIF